MENTILTIFPRRFIMVKDDNLKMEIAEELGLTDKIKEGGWKCLTAKESGRLGGIMAKRRKGAKDGNL
ncbi:MAG: alpha/beta-type small acid-soluble spore protein [Defluviitaleaceae bacterium]|nr:alpha/beta-type small acid-soluble spore protein [Defluviitaleaceae bacterium]